MRPGVSIMLTEADRERLDAIPQDADLVGEIAKAFLDPRVAHCFVQQLPHEGASDASQNVPVSEDHMAVSRLLHRGYRLAYITTTAVRHSHNYSWWQEFQRYFDIGTAHACAPWFRDLGARVSGEEMRFIKAEVQWLQQSGNSYVSRPYCSETACDSWSIGLAESVAFCPAQSVFGAACSEASGKNAARARCTWMKSSLRTNADSEVSIHVELRRRGTAAKAFDGREGVLGGLGPGRPRRADRHK
jgi:hypothetical protein